MSDSRAQQGTEKSGQIRVKVFLKVKSKVFNKKKKK